MEGAILGRAAPERAPYGEPEVSPYPEKIEN